MGINETADDQTKETKLQYKRYKMEQMFVELSNNCAESST